MLSVPNMDQAPTRGQMRVGNLLQAKYVFLSLGQNSVKGVLVLASTLLHSYGNCLETLESQQQPI